MTGEDGVIGVVLVNIGLDTVLPSSYQNGFVVEYVFDPSTCLIPIELNPSGQIELLILDVDGVLTDGTKVYDIDHNVLSKRYNILVYLRQVLE